MAAEGSCVCGEIRYSATTEANAGSVLCHCSDCRKISGSTHSMNLMVPDDRFKIISGTPKTWTKTADSGNTVTNFFCGNCGSTLYRETATFPNAKVLKAGTLDNGHENHKPVAELYAGIRVGWQPEIQGADQRNKMS